MKGYREVSPDHKAFSLHSWKIKHHSMWYLLDSDHPYDDFHSLYTLVMPRGIKHLNLRALPSINSRILQIIGTKFLPYILSYIDYPFQLTVDALTTRSSFTLSISLPYSRPLHNHKPLPCYELRYLHSLNSGLVDYYHSIRFTHVSNKPFNEFYSKLFYYHIGKLFYRIFKISYFIATL